MFPLRPLVLEEYGLTVPGAEARRVIQDWTLPGHGTGDDIPGAGGSEDHDERLFPP